MIVVKEITRVSQFLGMIRNTHVASEAEGWEYIKDRLMANHKNFENTFVMTKTGCRTKAHVSPSVRFEIVTENCTDRNDRYFGSFAF